MWAIFISGYATRFHMWTTRYGILFSCGKLLPEDVVALVSTAQVPSALGFIQAVEDVSILEKSIGAVSK